ncbi:hypothetical protein Apa02nite_017390 [Actinoplanes palleronii]|uniref:Uncharacterized protein n=1 Tax=Actinoplanes palleronii TaxID=113570 RepID=A0ABQ4B4P0_9ACTN|nr:hypothetical protein Apa02nite_017390 [Actinoplanes palleronii]
MIVPGDARTKIKFKIKMSCVRRGTDRRSRRDPSGLGWPLRVQNAKPSGATSASGPGHPNPAREVPDQKSPHSESPRVACEVRARSAPKVPTLGVPPGCV